MSPTDSWTASAGTILRRGNRVESRDQSATVDVGVPRTPTRRRSVVRRAGPLVPRAVPARRAGGQAADEDASGPRVAGRSESAFYPGRGARFLDVGLSACPSPAARGTPAEVRPRQLRQMIVLRRDPRVRVVSGKDERILELGADESLVVVRGGVDEMTHEVPRRPRTGRRACSVRSGPYLGARATVRSAMPPRSVFGVHRRRAGSIQSPRRKQLARRSDCHVQPFGSAPE